MSGQSQINLSTDAAPSGDTQQTPAGEQNSEVTYGGYKTVEELVAAHEALKSTNESTPAADEGKQVETPPVSKEIPAGDDAGEAAAQAAVQNAGLDWTALNSEYAEHGKLSDETYASLEAKGLPRSEVDTYIAGKQAQADAFDNAVYGAAGGATEYTALIEWAKNNLTQDEKVAFNDAVTSGKLATAQLAVEALAGRRAAKRGTPPAGLLNGGGAAAGVQPFKSQQEVTAAMMSKQYKTDEAYRQQVQDRLRESAF